MEYKNIPVHRVQGCTQSIRNVHRVWDCISLYAEYKLFVSYDTSHLNQMMICMTLSCYNNIHMQSHFRLCSSRGSNFPGIVGKLTLHNSNYIGNLYKGFPTSTVATNYNCKNLLLVESHSTAKV